MGNTSETGEDTGSQIKREIDDQAWDQLQPKAHIHILYKVEFKLWTQIENQVRGQVSNQVEVQDQKVEDHE